MGVKATRRKVKGCVTDQLTEARELEAVCNCAHIIFVYIRAIPFNFEAIYNKSDSNDGNGATAILSLVLASNSMQHHIG